MCTDSLIPVAACSSDMLSATFFTQLSDSELISVAACSANDSMLEGAEVINALKSLGVHPSVEQLSSTTGTDRPIVALSEFPRLVERIRQAGCPKGPVRAPMARRGMRFDQLVDIEDTFVRSGWLRVQCDTFNASKRTRVGNN